MALAVNSINSYNINTKNTKQTPITKIAATVGSTLGLAASAVCIAKGHGLKIPNPFKTKEYIDIFKKIEFNEKDVIALASSSIVGVLTGNKVALTINKHLFKEDSYRKLNWKDWAVQADNVCLVTSMSAPATNIAKATSKIIPFAHIIPGYCVGTKN